MAGRPGCDVLALAGQVGVAIAAQELLQKLVCDTSRKFFFRDTVTFTTEHELEADTVVSPSDDPSHSG